MSYQRYHGAQYHIRQWKDVQVSGERRWFPEIQPGWKDVSKGLMWGESGKTVVSPGKDPRYLNLKVSPSSKDWVAKPIAMPISVLDSPTLEISMTLPQTGPVWISMDAEFTMYYSQVNSTPFDYSSPWTFTIQPDTVLTELGNWVVSYMDASTYHARIIGQINARAVKALKPFRLGIAFRCGTATPKGQWLFTAIRCEAAGGLVSAGIPIEEASPVEPICAGQDLGFVVLDP